MTETLDQSVKRLRELLIRVSQVNKGCKLAVRVDEHGVTHLEVQEPGYHQAISRFLAGDSRKITCQFLEKLYNEVFAVLSNMQDAYPLLNVLLESPAPLASIENRHYLSHKYCLDSLCDSVNKSITGLQNLAETYEQDPKLLVLASDTREKMQTVSEFAKRLEVAYDKKGKLAPLSLSPATIAIAATTMTSPSVGQLSPLVLPASAAAAGHGQQHSGSGSSDSSSHHITTNQTVLSTLALKKPHQHERNHTTSSRPDNKGAAAEDEEED